MRNKYIIFTGLALILVVVLVAIFTPRSVPDEEAASLPAAEELTVSAASAPDSQEVAIEEPTAAPTEEPQQVSKSASTEDQPATALDMEDFTSTTGFFSVKVPVGWSSVETLPGAAFVTANSEAALERYRTGTAVEPGDLVLNIGFLPYELLQQGELRALNIQFEAPPDIFLESLMPMFRLNDDTAAGDAELISLDADLDAGMLNISGEERAGQVLVFTAGDNVIAVVSSVVNPGEFAQFQEITQTIAAGTKFNGASGALYGTLLGG